MTISISDGSRRVRNVFFKSLWDKVQKVQKGLKCNYFDQRGKKCNFIKVKGQI